MKIKRKHVLHLQSAIQKTLQLNPQLVDRYEHGEIQRSCAVKDLQVRFNFDLLHMSVSSEWICQNIYVYANDDHIETALSHICPKVTRRY